METIVKGRLGYNLLERELLKRGWDVYVPILENTKIDCIAVRDASLIRIQIKTLDSKGGLPVRKVSHNQGEYKIFHYDASVIDFFVGVDIESEDVYIVPESFSSKYVNTIGKTALQQFKNDFSQLD